MSFQWNTILAPEEVVQRDFTISLQYRNIVVGFILIAGIVVFFQSFYIGIVIVLLGGLYWLYLSNAKHYAFTDKRVVLVDSFFGKSVVSIDYKQITDIEVYQSAMDQLGGWGTLVINTAGTHVPEVRISFLANVDAVKQQLDEIRDKKG